MNESLQKNYFLAVRISILLALQTYLFFIEISQAGASSKMLLFLALFTAAVTALDFTSSWKQLTVLLVCWLLLIRSAILWGWIMIPVLIFLCYETLSRRKAAAVLYIFPLFIIILPGPYSHGILFLLTFFIGIIYLQHDFIVEAYCSQAKADMLSEQALKQDIHQKEHKMQEEMHTHMLLTQNRILEERTQLSQALHDRLGHGINGSVYQLEAAKLLMDKDSSRSQAMIQAVIDQLRTGMDQIRLLLRQKQPEKYVLATSQLEILCQNCREKGIQASLITEGELSRIPTSYLELILDNAYEAVSNALKYAQCTKIEIRLCVLNKVLRCSISDNGIGCSKIVDGMGIAGMRKRVREANGILDFSSDAGFTINMLLPLDN